MKIKFKNGGIVKLQNAGRVPLRELVGPVSQFTPAQEGDGVQKPVELTVQQKKLQAEIEAIAQYNRENGTNFYTMEQVNRHKASKPNAFRRMMSMSLNPIPTSNFGMMAVPNPEGPHFSTVGNELGVAGTAVVTPLLASELAAGAGLGGLRIGGGLAGSAVLEHLGAKKGKEYDLAHGTNYMSDLYSNIGALFGYGVVRNLLGSVGKGAAYQISSATGKNIPD